MYNVCIYIYKVCIKCILIFTVRVRTCVTNRGRSCRSRRSVHDIMLNYITIYYTGRQNASRRCTSLSIVTGVCSCNNHLELRGLRAGGRRFIIIYVYKNHVAGALINVQFHSPVVVTSVDNGFCRKKKKTKNNKTYILLYVAVT